ncbi:hypothetical protein CEXT_588191 [Caerostris extrusa]|uniref:Uncharacterized protein n=1 Tax=Caerostris extrusa TaxID=172846 RepID=A0AAV4WP87_CAEEX|nr:hypothetical protein CEXT_588191 [Caerostris extrusa]
MDSLLRKFNLCNSTSLQAEHEIFPFHKTFNPNLLTCVTEQIFDGDSVSALGHFELFGQTMSETREGLIENHFSG